MTKRKLNPADFGLTEEQWRALDADQQLHYCRRAHYQRNKAKRQEYQRNYEREKRQRAIKS